MLDTLRFWLDRGVDGFRMDVIALIIKDEQLRDNPPNPDAPPGLSENDLFRRLLQVYNLDQEEVHPALREIRQVLDEYEERVAIGELWGPLERWVRYYGEHGDELHLPFNFRLMHIPWQASAMRQSVDEMEAALPDFAWPNYVLNNHDFPRFASRAGGQEQARLAAMMLLTLRGTPTLYYGDELGMENGVIPPDKIQDPQGVNLGAGWTRDVCRTPMQWNAGKNAGFSEVEPWLPVSADFAHRNVAVMLGEPGSILNLHRKLLALRKGSPALKWGSYRAVDTACEDCFVYCRETEDESYLVALNFASQARAISVQERGDARIALSTHIDRDAEIDLNDIQLRSHEGLIVRLAG